jgi:hypothetical protein
MSAGLGERPTLVEGIINIYVEPWLFTIQGYSGIRLWVYHLASGEIIEEDVNGGLISFFRLWV